MLKVGIVGATGYGGLELIRLLARHPHVQIHRLYSSSSEGETLAHHFPHLQQLVLPELQAIDAEQMAQEIDLVFLATPPGISAGLTPQLVAAGLRVIDLSGDFRLRDGSVYRQWYKKEPAAPEELGKAVYGLPEWQRQAIMETRLVANPGCYPTATLLGLLPLAHSGWIDPLSLIIDAKSGVSGAGRGVSVGVHFSEVNENLSAYKVAVHQHTPEIEQELARQAGQEMVVQFTPHLIPMTRGILITAYARLTQEIGENELQELYAETYAQAPFVRLRPFGSHPKTKEVYGSNYCDIALHLDRRTGRVIVLAVIDNLVKGAAGQAVQNMNLMCGFAETAGLDLSPLYP